MNLKQFRKKFAGAPYGVKEFAELVVEKLKDKSNAGVALREAALAHLNAEADFIDLLEENEIDVG